MKSIAEIEFDSAKNQSHYFTPLERTLRGRFDVNRMGEPNARRDVWDEIRDRPVPGQRLEANFDTGTATIVEPLHDSEHEAIRKRIVKEGFELPTAFEIVTSLNSDTLAFWMQLAVDSGYATIVRGTIPGYKKENVKFLPRKGQSDTDRLAAALEKQTEILAKLLEKA